MAILFTLTANHFTYTVEWVHGLIPDSGGRYRSYVDHHSRRILISDQTPAKDVPLLMVTILEECWEVNEGRPAMPLPALTGDAADDEIAQGWLKNFLGK